MINYRIVKYIGLFLLCLIIISFKQLLPSLFSINHFTYAIDSLITESVQQDIVNYVEQIPGKHSLSFQELAYKIEERFSFIEVVAIEHLAPDIAYIACNAQKPLSIINNSFVLTNQGCLYNKDIFLSLTTEQLPHITLPSLEKDITESLLTVMNTIDPIVFSQFTLSWINDTKIYLYDKEHKQFSIIFNKNQLPDKELLNHYAHIKQKLDEQGVFTHTKKNYVADIRFKDQIVVSRA
ncbi:MAG TPA: hypothetical protein ENI08_01415 [Candidatus Dependentiae bacterium]|nr:hypothetical protein [Candidatus Dependentiae bacterium]